MSATTQLREEEENQTFEAEEEEEEEMRIITKPPVNTTPKIHYNKDAILSIHPK